MTPQTKYVRAGDVHVAYQVVGDGPIDLVWVPGSASQMACLWEEPSVARFYRRLTSFSRLIMFDKRGTGLSDRTAGVPTLEDRMDDVRAVLDAVGSERAAIVGQSEGGAIGALFAATYPERTACLVAIGSGATSWLPSEDLLSATLAYVDERWGTGGSALVFAPSVADDSQKLAWFARWEQLSGSPGSIKAMIQMNRAFDVRAALPTVSAPTLVIHRTGDMAYSAQQGRALAEGIRGARFVELPGRDHAPWFDDADTILELIEEHVTGEPGRVDPDRVLATTLFTDIVDSTALAGNLGDRRWKELLDDYDAVVAKELERVNGRLVKTTGDGTLATFDSPGRALRCTAAIRAAATSLDLQLRAGLHAGEIELRGEDVAGLAVVIAQRVSALAAGGEILVSSTVKDLVAGSGIAFDHRGEHRLKGVEDPWTLYAVRE